jgi:hypothetical protein
MKVRMASRLTPYSRLYSARASFRMALRDFVSPVAEESNAGISGIAGTVGWELRAHPKNIEKIDVFARDRLAFVARFVLEVSIGGPG